MERSTTWGPRWWVFSSASAVSNRPVGVFTWQVFLGESLDAEHIGADCTTCLLTLTIPVH